MPKPMDIKDMKPREPRPVLDIPRSRYDWAMETLALLGVVTTLALTVAYWGALSDRVPNHFGFSGRPDAWSSRGALLVIPVTAAVLYLGLTALAKSPRHFNYLWPITPENAPAQYRLARQLLVNLKVVVVCTFGWILWGTIQTDLAVRNGLGAAFLPLMEAAILGVIAFYFVKARRAR